MTRSGRIPAVLAAALALTVVLAAPRASAKDVYKASLDPAIPHHKAILETLKLIEANPNDAALHNDLGCLIAWDGFWRDALREFDTAAKLDGKDSRPYFNAGLVHVYKLEFYSASRSFRHATKRDPGNWPAWWMLGFAEERLGREDAAVDAYKVSMRLGTALFQVKNNPFAAQSQLKARALLETYGRRAVDAALPFTNQLEDPARLQVFFQPVRRAAATPSSQGEETRQTGPVVTAVPPSTTGPARPPDLPVRRTFDRSGRGPVQVVPEPNRRRMRPVPEPEAPAPTQGEPQPAPEGNNPEGAPQPAPGGAPQPGPGGAPEPGPGGGQPQPQPGPGGG